jgi:hypothetical protein
MGALTSAATAIGSAVQHVLGTLDPRIPRLGPWQAIEASNGGDLVIDLSGETFDREEPGLLDGLDATAAEISVLDQVLAELADDDTWAGDEDLAAL